MVTHVIKRNGRKVKFNQQKIEEVLKKAFVKIEELDDKNLQYISKVASDIGNSSKEVLTVDEIRDMIEKKLMASSHKDVAKSYINYRYLKQLANRKYNDLWEAIEEKLAAKNVQNQNANVDERSFSGRVGEASGVVTKQYALENLVSPMARANHENNEVYIHDLDHYALGDHNCLSIPFDELLANGFTTRQSDVRPANSIGTAMQLVAVIFQLQSLNQFGGVAATHLDWTMVPYVRKSFYKHFRDGMKWLEQAVLSDKYTTTLSIDSKLYKDYPNVYKYAFEMTDKECHQAVEGMYHNLNTLQSRSGGQVPFTSINYGTCTLPEGRMVIENILNVSIEGLGPLHKTSIFPCGIFQYMKGVNDKPGTPNYDLYRLALKSTAKRLYPNYANIDWSVNAGYDRNDPTTYVSTMGALAGHEHLYVKLENEVYDVSIKNFFEYCKEGILKEARPCKVFFNKGRCSLEGDRHLQKKSNVEVGSGVYAITYLPEDVTYIGSSENVNRRLTEHRCSIRLTGGIDARACFGDTNLDHYSFEVLNYCSNFKEVERQYIQSVPTINLKGISQRYYKSAHGNNLISERPNFRQDRTIPQDFISLEDRDIQVLDRDNKWVKVKHIFKNDKKNSPFMMHIYYKEYENECCLSCTEDHPIWTGAEFVRADHLQVGDYLYRADGVAMPIIAIGYHWEPVDSYDIGTVTGSFIGSDVIMHNCRTYNGYDINGMGFKKDGRGNICPVTIILPTLAMEAKQLCETQQDDNIVPYFMDILDKKIHEAKDMLLERYDWICNQDASAAPFMYQNNTMAGYNPKEGVRSALKHGTIVIGQLGLAECLQILIGCDHTTDEGMALAKQIEQLFKDRCAEFKKEWHYDVSGPSKEDIEKRMLSLAKKRLRRELTEEEIQTIKRFKRQN